MKFGKKTLGTAAVLAAGAAAIVAVPGLATHSWSSYHWERTTPQITVPVIDWTTGEWATSNRVQTAVNDWNQSIYIDSTRTKGNGSNTACSIVAGEINVCNDDYGSTGWLGIASISITRGRTTHIVGGVTKLNDFYFDDPNLSYNTDIWRQLVTCQEIGHDYGLGHQNEDFGSDLTDSCMEYTSTPDSLDRSPDTHDYAQLELIYAHDHGGGTTSPGPGKGGKGKKLGASGNGPADWGQAIGFDAQGRPNRFKRSLASYDIITHVTWTMEATGDLSDHDHDVGRRQHSGDRHF